MFEKLSIPGLQLRLSDPVYAEQLFAVTDKNREHLRQWLPWVDTTRHEGYSRLFLEGAKRQLQANNGFQCLIFYNDSLAGCIGLHSLDWANKKTSLGYWLASEFVGKGLMSESCRAVTDYLFKEWKLNRVEIKAGVMNAKSRAIPERLGFTLEGVVRQAEWLRDHYIDHAVYGMLAQEWDNQDRTKIRTGGEGALL